MQAQKNNFLIVNEIKGKLPSLPFAKIKNKILGKKYDLSLVFVGSLKMRRLNKVYRRIDKPTDILSFPIAKNSGEIFICLSESKKEALKFEREYKNFMAFLFIHGLVHLLGHDHGNKMEKIEEKHRKYFKV
jgi:probable rRNA maturation factor